MAARTTDAIATVLTVATTRDIAIANACIGGMTSLNLNVAEIAALVGDPARANILAALMDGRAFRNREGGGIVPARRASWLSRHRVLHSDLAPPRRGFSSGAGWLSM
jgi:hypothetical protein